MASPDWLLRADQKSSLVRPFTSGRIARGCRDVTSRGDCLPLTSVTAQGRPSRLSRASETAEEEEERKGRGGRVGRVVRRCSGGECCMQGDDQVRFVSRSPWSALLLLTGFGLCDLGRHDFVNNGDARSNQMREYWIGVMSRTSDRID